MKFSAMLLFTTLWSLIVYFPMAHMVWGKGGLLNAFLGGKFPCFDFAGGTVVHITSGVSALVCALYLGKRLEFPSPDMKPHSMVLSFIGACLLWVGWFGFNAGSALAASSLPPARSWLPIRRCGRRALLDARGVVCTPASRAAGRYLRRRGGARGHYAGFRLRPAILRAGHRFPGWNGLLLHGGQGETVVRLRRRAGCLRRAWHGGTLGAILTGVFATSAINSGLKDSAATFCRSVSGWQGLAGAQPDDRMRYSVAIAVVGTLVILKVCDVLIGLRISPEQEREGLTFPSTVKKGISSNRKVPGDSFHEEDRSDYPAVQAR